MITRSLYRGGTAGVAPGSAAHKQRLNDLHLRTQLGGWNSYYITIRANEAKTQEDELMQQ